MFNPNQFNKTLENRIRLGIMAALMVNSQLDFTALKELLAVTDGNLSSHLKSLQEAGYVTMSKQFISLKPNTSYQITSSGRQAFEEHLAQLERLINQVKPGG